MQFGEGGAGTFSDGKLTTQIKGKFNRSRKVLEEFVRAVKGGPTPGSNFDYAAPFTEVMLLGIIACRHGGKIEWDAKNMKITNRPELNVYLKDPVNKGWEYGESLWS